MAVSAFGSRGRSLFNLLQQKVAELTCLRPQPLEELGQKQYLINKTLSALCSAREKKDSDETTVRQVLVVPCYQVILSLVTF